MLNGNKIDDNKITDEENAINEKSSKPNHLLLILSIIIGLIVPICLLPFILLFNLSLLIFFAIISFLIGIILLIIYLVKRKKITLFDKLRTLPAGKTFPVIAIILDLLSVILIFAGIGLLYIGSSVAPLAMIVLLLAVCAPIASIVFSTIALFKRKQISKLGVTLSIIAIAIPMLAILVFVILPTAGVSIIRFM